MSQVNNSKSFRRIVICFTISKVMECMQNHQLVKYLEYNNLIGTRLHYFHKTRSTGEVWCYSQLWFSERKVVSLKIFKPFDKALNFIEIYHFWYRLLYIRTYDYSQNSEVSWGFVVFAILLFIFLNNLIFTRSIDLFHFTRPTVSHVNRVNCNPWKMQRLFINSEARQ